MSGWRTPPATTTPSARAIRVSLRFDDEAPTAVFEAPDPADPLSVVASVADRGAGVVAGSIEARRIGEPVWRDLGARLGGDRLVGRLDDAALPDGTYEVRAHLRDGAGNERTADRRRDGSPMLVSLPARAATRIVLGERRRCKRRARPAALRARDRGPVRGNGITVRGELRAGDRPLVHSPIVVLTAPRNGGPLSRAATVITDAAGRFSFATGVGPSRTVRFDYGGTRVTRPALAEVRVLVRARSSIAVDRRFALNGQAVRFRGRLAAGPDSRRRQADRPPGLLPRAVAHVRDAPHGSARPLVLRLPLRGHQRASSRTASGLASGARRPIRMSSAAPGSCA